jgi:hypothetical protein
VLELRREPSGAIRQITNRYPTPFHAIPKTSFQLLLLNSIALYKVGAIALSLTRKVAAFIFGLLVTGL